MLRDLSPEVLEALQRDDLSIRFFYEGQFRTGTARYWSGTGPMVVGDKTFTGFGDLMGVGNVEETTDIKANGVTVSIAGVTDASVALALNEGQRNKPGHVWIGFLYPDDVGGLTMVSDDDGGSVLGGGGDVISDSDASPSGLIGDLCTVFRGRLDGLDLPDGADTATVSVTYVHELQALETPKTVRYTDQEQKRIYPEDKGLEYIIDLQDKTVPWGARS